MLDFCLSPTKSIFIKVDTETAEAFERLSVEEREKIEFFLSLQMKNVLKSEVSLLEVMEKMNTQEDMALVKAIQEGENTPSVSREEVFKIFNNS